MVIKGELGERIIQEFGIGRYTLLYTKHIHNNGEGSGTQLQYSCLENPMDGGAWWVAVHGVTKSRTQLSDFSFTFMHWRKKWQPTPVFLPGESQGRGSLVGCRLWGHTELDTTEATQQQQQQQQHTQQGNYCIAQRTIFNIT